MAASHDLLGEMQDWVSQTQNPTRDRPRPASRKVDWRRIWPICLLALAFLPLLALHARDLWKLPHYQFFPLLIPGALALAWRSTRWLGPLQPGVRWLSFTLLAVVWVLLALDVLFISKPGGAVTALLALLTVAYALGGRRLVSAVMPAWAFLWLAIPLPQQLDTALVAGLQDLVSSWSSHLLDVVHVDHLMAGNVVEVVDRRLLVDQACSGIYSLLTLIMATGFYLLWTRASGPKSLALMLATIFWVIAGNVLRVVSVVTLGVWYGIDVSHGWRHEMIGILGLFLMLAMIASAASLWDSTIALADRFRRLAHFGLKIVPKQVRPYLARRLDALLKPAEVVAQEGPLSPTSFPSLRRSCLRSPWVGVAFGLLFLPQLAFPDMDWNWGLLDNGDFYKAAFKPLVEDTAPRHAGSFNRVGFSSTDRGSRSTWGEHSKFWPYSGSTSGLAVSLDYPFVGWHDLFVCYRGSGWKLTPRSPEIGDQAWANPATVEADLENSEGKYGYLVFGLFDEQGRQVAPPGDRNLNDALQVWEARVQGQWTHQIQVFVERVGAPVDPDERRAARELFDKSREAIHHAGLKIKETRK